MRIIQHSKPVPILSVCDQMYEVPNPTLSCGLIERSIMFLCLLDKFSMSATYFVAVIGANVTDLEQYLACVDGTPFYLDTIVKSNTDCEQTYISETTTCVGDTFCIGTYQQVTGDTTGMQLKMTNAAFRRSKFLSIFFIQNSR